MRGRQMRQPVARALVNRRPRAQRRPVEESFAPGAHHGRGGGYLALPSFLFEEELDVVAHQRNSHSSLPGTTAPQPRGPKSRPFTTVGCGRAAVGDAAGSIT